MPVVRELVNRLSFKINPGDKKNAENAFEGMKSQGKGVINVAGLIGNAFKLAATSVVALTTAGGKMFTEFEQNTGASKFFSKNAEEAQKLLASLDAIAEKSETTSRREARQASKVLSQLSVDVEKFIPFIEKISVARPDMDFSQVAESLSSVIKGGDIQALIDLVPGIKDDLEVLSKTSFGKPFAEIFQEDRATLVLEKLIASQARIDELAAEQQSTLNVEFVKLMKEGSDFLLKFGETTAPEIKEAVTSIREMLKELNDSEGFWATVKDAADSIASVIGFFASKEKRVEILSEGRQVYETDRKTKEEQARKGEASRLNLPLGELISDALGDLFSGFGMEGANAAVQTEFGSDMVKLGGVNSADTGANAPIKNQRQSETGQTTINIGGEIVVKGEGLQGADIEALSSELSKSVIAQVENGFKAVIVQNGGFATPSL